MSSAKTKKQTREELRNAHQVRIITDSEEGVATKHLSNGVYGFTYAPAQDGVPLFQKPATQSYEVHKLRDGSEHILCYVSDAGLAKLESAVEVADVTLYPEEFKDAVNLTSVAVSRVASQKFATSRIDGNYLKILLHK
jgi:hypothetical protein